MKKHLINCLTGLAFSALAIITPSSSYASHIIGAEMTYSHVSGLTYKVTINLYGDCNSASLPAFSGLPVSTPQVCVFDGSTSVSNFNLSLPSPTCGTEVTPLCTGISSTCTNVSFPISGIKKFVYSGNVTLPYASATWRFIYTGNNGSTSGTYSCSGSLTGISTASPASAGRSASITNITAGSSVQLIDTLNNSSAANSSVTFLSNPAAWYPNLTTDYFYPDAVDPDGDSLHFELIAATNGAGACGTVGGSITYVTPFTGAQPLSVTTPVTVNGSTGLLTFTPNAIQRSVVVYNVEEFRSGVLVGTTQHETNFLVATAGTITATTPCMGLPDAGSATVATGCGVPDTLEIAGDYIGCGLSFQWQSSAYDITWTNISGATTSAYPITPISNKFYRCEVTCVYSGLSSYSSPVYVPLSSGGILHNAVTTPVDTFCKGPVIYMSACGTGSFNVTTFFGDGTSGSTTLSTTPLCNATITHMYPAPGSYYIYEVLYNGTTPVDTLGFTYEYQYCRTLPVKFYYDANSDCIMDGSESYLYLPVLTEVDSDGVAVDTISATSGFYYKAFGGTGTVYTFKVISAPAGLTASCPSSGILYDTISSAVTDYPSLYFAFNCSGSSSFDLAEYASFRAGPHSGGATMIVENNYCTPKTATYTMTFSPKYAFVSAYPPPASVAGNLITWNVDSVSAVKPPYVFNVSFWKAGAPDLTIGDTVHSDYLVTPTTGDAAPANNSSSRIDTVQASYDPNYLAVNPAGFIPSGTQLQYTIGFENTGNGVAHDVYIMDTISDYIDLASLKVVASSAKMQIAPYISGSKAVVKFDFPNINLPDSSHHNQNQGMVIFTVKTKTGLANGTTILSNAGIYFDDNAPVPTNTVEDIICNGGSCSLSVTGVLAGQEIELFPNPATNKLTIRADNSAWHSYTITNTIGQTMDQKPIAAYETIVNVATLPAGLYYITFNGSNGTKVLKFVKM